MEIEDNYLDEIFDMNPIQPEIHSTSTNHHHYTTNNQNSWEYSSCYGAQETINPSSSSSSLSSSAPKLISFENLLNIVAPPNSNLTTSQVIHFSAKEILSHKIENNNNNNICKSSGRSTLQARDHVVAERKRRENLSQLFVNLSQVVPGLRKLDKGSVLEDAIKHLKELQERVSALEEEVKDTSTDDCCPIVNLAENNRAEIKARTSDKHVLIKIHCKKQKGLMSRVPSQLEKMHLSVVDMRILPFGAQPRLDITLLAQMRSEFSGTAKDIVDHMQRLFDSPC